MERQSTSKLFRALIAVVAFFVLCTSAILFASCGTDPLTCEHDLDGSKVVAITQGNCGKTGTVTYECSKCGAEVTVTGTLATGNHTWVNGRCSVCGMEEDKQEGLTLQQVKDDLTTVLNTISGKVDKANSAVDALTQKIVAALSDEDFTIPSLEAKLEDIQAALDALDFDFNIGDIELVADSTNGSTLGEVLSSLYKQVNALYNNYAAENKQSLYDLLVGGTGAEAHVHNWVLELKKDAEGKTHYSCTEPNTYVWGCAFCDKVKEGEEVTVMATGHATDFKHALTDEDTSHCIAATCITPERVEGYCANCNQYTGEWTEVGKPTYEHHYVKETEVVTDTDKTGVCTSKVVSVYHCETCGGAYVANENSGSSNGQHNYYYVADENGSNKRAMTDTEKLQVWNDAHPDDAEVTDLSQLSVKETQDLNELLKEGRFTVKEDGVDKTYTYGLNIVYYSEPTCVDPSLIVVECMECGVRYAYTFGQPDGHNFKIVEKERDATCTMDGVKQYYYCDKCGYYFFLEDGVELSDNGKITKGAASLQYTREYMTDLEDKVINDTSTSWKTNKAAYDKATELAPALGHDYAVVYTNNVKCVTAQTYILVCKRDNCTGNESNWKTGTFDTVITTEGSGAAAKYFVNGLDGYNDADDLLGSLKAVTAREVSDATTSDLTKEYNAMFAKESGAYVKTQKEQLSWLIKHGYLVRDAADDEIWGSLVPAQLDGKDKTNEPDATKDLTDAELTELVKKFNDLQTGDFDFATLYTAKNMIYAGSKTAPTNDKFVDPVTGHTFNEKAITVVHNCVMYERHVYFCTVCGQETLTPAWQASNVGDEDDENDDLVYGPKDAPFLAAGDTDDYTAGFKGSDHPIPDDYKGTDLKQEWVAVVEKATAQGEYGWVSVLDWLAGHGYLNDFRPSLATPYDSMSESGVILAGMNTYWGKAPETLPTIKDLEPFFTEKNVLGEFTVEFVVDPMAGTINPVELGHTFDAVMLLGAETCDEPGHYVYVCSKCGIAKAWGVNEYSEKVADELKAKLPTLTYQSGTQIVDTKLPQLDSNGTYKMLTDNQLYRFATPAERQAGNKAYDAKYGVKIGGGNDSNNDDLQQEWNALTTDEETTESDIFDWLLKKGYLNNVIDTYILNGYTIKGEGDADDVEYKSLLSGLMTGKTEVTTTLYKQARDLYVGSADQRAAVLAIAKDIALKAGHTKTVGVAPSTSTVGDITFFYTRNADPETELAPKAAVSQWNKLTNVAKTEVPQAGHYFATEDGKFFNDTTDPLCLSFDSELFMQHYEAHELIYWVEPGVKEDGSYKTDASGNYITDDNKPAGWTVYGTFDPEDLDPDFVAQVKEYGIIAACRRKNCPQHTIAYDAATKAEKDVKEGWTDKLNRPFTAGYYAGQDHETAYVKYAALGANKEPDTSVIQTKDSLGTPVFYNMKLVEEYRTEEIAGEYLAEGDDWATLVATEATGATPEAKAAAKKKLDDAAQKAMDEDLLNLRTLQKIWNSLFIPTEWLNPKNADGTDNTALATQRQTKYPTYTFGEDVLTEGKVDLEKLATKFGDAALLWSGDSLDNITSAWRPVNDLGRASCWISMRCKWYEWEGGDKCDYEFAESSHDWPKQGDFNFDTHVANCQHRDYCDTCGYEGGTPGTHNLIDVTTFTGNNQTAWLEVLNHKDDLAWLKDIVKVDLDGNGKIDGWNDWKVVEGTCYIGAETGENIGEGSEEAHGIYFCSGELEVIYNKVVNGGADWSDVVGADKSVKLFTTTDASKITWSTVDESKFGTTTAANYYVEVIHPAHTFVHKYFYRNADGTMGDEIPADVWNNGWNRIICEQGYVEADVCVALRRDGTTECGHIWNEEADATVPGTTEAYVRYVLNPDYDEDTTGSQQYIKTTEECSELVSHEPAGHYLAPILNYWTYKGRYTAPTAEKNAELDHVCTICGVNWNGVYGDFTSGGEGTHVQYHLADGEQIKAWNAYYETTEKPSPTKFAQELRTEDYKPVTAEDLTPNPNTFFETGHVVFEEDGSVTATGTGLALVTGRTLVTVGEGKTLSLDTRVSSNRKLNVNSTSRDRAQLTIEGTLKEDGTITSTLDLTNVPQLDVNNADLILRNLKVKELSLLPSVGGTVLIENCEVTYSKTGGVIGTNNNYANENPVKITIKDSKIAASGSPDTALLLNQGNAELTASNSTFFGAENGVAIRSGKATFTECTFVTTTTAYSGAWGSGTQIPANAALVVGNGQNGTSYGNANVTLTKCQFKVGTAGDVMTVALSDEFTEGCYALAIYSPTAEGGDEATVTVDTETNTAIGTHLHKEGAASEYVYKPVFEGSKAEQAAAAAEAIENFKEGTLVLPEGLGELTVAEGDSGEYAYTIVAGETIELELNDNTLAVTNGISVNGNLTIRNGNVKIGDYNLTVKTGSELTLDNVVVTQTKGDSALYIKGGKLVVNNSKIYGNSVGFMTNEQETESADVTMIDTTLASKTDVAVVINTLGTYLFQNCTFYGQQVGAWVRGSKNNDSDKVTFEGCQFYTGNTTMTWLTDDNWASGTRLPKTVLAALLVGDGSTAYGSVKAVEVKSYTKPVATAAATAAPEVVKTKFGTATLSTSNEIKAGTAWGKAKPFVVALYGEQTVNVKFDKDAYTALGTNNKLTTEETKSSTAITNAATLLLYSNAKAGQATVVWTDKGEGETVVENDFEKVVALTGGKDAVEAAAPEAIKDVATNGGTVTLPKQEKGQEATVTLTDDTLTVAEDTTINLNGNTLKLKETEVEGSGLRSGLSVTGTLVLDGGKVEGQLSVGQAANVTIKNVELVHPEAAQPKDQSSFYGITVNSAQTSTAKLTVENSSVSAVIPLYINGNDDGATIELKNSDFLGVDGHGCWLAGNATVTATDCNFYGSVYAVQVCSGTVTFNNCNFMTTGDSFGNGEKTTIQYGGPGIPSSTNAPLVINAKGDGYDIATVTVNGGNFYNIDAKEGDTIKCKPEDVFKEKPENTDGYTEIKSMADSSKTLGWVKLSTDNRCDISLAYIQNKATGKLTLEVTGITDKLLVNALVFTIGTSGQNGLYEVNKVAGWEIATYFTVKGCTPTQVTE